MTGTAHRRSRLMVFAMLTLGLLAASVTSAFAVTYTWVGGPSASWNNAASWNPTRTTPASSDIMVFNGGTETATGLTGSQPIAQLLLQNGAQVTLQASAAATLQIGGSTGADLDVPASCSLTLSGSSAIQLALGAAGTASVSGQLTVGGAAHTLTSSLLGAIVFNSGANLTQSSTFTGSVFGTTGTANVATFTNGSKLILQGGSNPFGLSAPNSKVVFQTGSLYSQQSSGGLSVSGRTYANFEVNLAGTVSGNGASALTMDALTVASGTCNLAMTGGFNIRGSVSVFPGATLSLNPASAAPLTFNGSSAQTIGGAGTLTIGGNHQVSFNNPAGVVIARDLTLPAVQVAAGLLDLQGPTGVTFTANSVIAAPATVQVTSGALTLQALLSNNGSFSVQSTLVCRSGALLSGLRPSYGPASLLVYDGASFLVGGEWGPGTGGPGVPASVTVAAGAGNTVTMPAGDRTCTLTLTIASGTLALSASTGDLTVGGDWNHTGGTFIPNGRTVHLNGSGTQTVQGPGTETFASLFVENGGGGVHIATTVSATADIYLAAPVTGGDHLNVGARLRVADQGTLDASPVFSSAATLQYELSTMRATGPEWVPGTVVGPGIPFGVTLQCAPSGGVLVTTPLSCAGDLTINSGTMMCTADLSLGGNFVRTGGTFGNPDTKLVFAGSSPHFVQAAGGQSFGSVTIESGSTVSLHDDVTVTALTTDALTLRGTLDLGGRTLALTGDGAAFRVDGGLVSVTGTASSVLEFAAPQSVVSVSGGALNIGLYVKVVDGASLNVGTNVVALDGTLQLDAGAQVTGRILYGPAARLIYHGSNTAGDEWVDGVGAPDLPSVVTVDQGVLSTPAAPRRIPVTFAIFDAEAKLRGPLTLAGSGVDALSMENGTVDLNGQTMELIGNAARIAVDGGASAVTSTALIDGFVRISAPVTVTGAGGSLTLGHHATLTISDPYDISSVTFNVLGTVRLENGGTCVGSPVYGSGSTLVLATAAPPGGLWTSGTSLGVGVPEKVEIDGATLVVTVPGPGRTCPGDLTVTAGTLDLDGHTLTVGGNWTVASGASFTDGIGTGAVTFDGSGAQVVTGPAPMTFPNLFMTNGGTCALGVGVTTTAMMLVDRPLSGASQLSVAGTLQVADHATFDAAPLYLTPSTLQYVNTSPRSIGAEWTSGASSGNGAPRNVGTLNATVVFPEGGEWICAGDLTVNGAAVFNGNVVIGGLYARNGTATQGPNGTIRFNGTDFQGWTAAGPENYGSVIVDKPGGSVLLMSPSTTVQSLTLTQGDLRLANDLAIGVTFTAQSTAFLSLQGHDVRIGAETAANDGTIRALDASGGRVVFRGTAPQVLAGSGHCGDGAFPLTLTVANSGGGLAIAPPQNVHVSAMEMQRGSVTNSGGIVIGDIGAALAVVRFGDGTLVPTFTAGSFDVTPGYIDPDHIRIEYLNEATQRTLGSEIPASRLIGRLTAANAQGVLLGGHPLSCSQLELNAGTLTVGSGNTLTMMPGGSVTAAGGTLAAGDAGGAIAFAGAGTMTGSLDLNDLALNGGAVTFGAGETVHHLLRLDGGSVAAGGESPIFADGSTLDYASPLVTLLGNEWRATGPGGLPYNVTISAGTLDFGVSGASTPRTARGSFTLNPGAGLVLGANAGGDLDVQGAAIALLGNFTPNGRFVILDGGGLQTVSPTAVWSGMRVNNPSGVSLTADLSLDGMLDLVAGRVSTGGHVLAVSGGGAVARTDGWVDGRLRRHFDAPGTSLRFDIGDAASYAPINVTTTAQLAPFDLTISTSSGDDPAIATSGIDASRSMNRTFAWDTQADLGATRCAVSFPIVASDLDPGANPLAFGVRRKDAGDTWYAQDIDAWSSSEIRTSNTVPQGTFQLGELVGRSLIVNVVGNGTVARNPNLTSFPDGSTVQLTANPGAGFTFMGWSGDASGNANPYSLLMNGDKTVTATFADVTAPLVHVTAPNGGETWQLGTPHDITWDASDDGGLDHFDIYLSTDDGATYPTAIATALSGSTRTFTWHPPAAVLGGARIRVVAVDGWNNSGHDESDASFTIVAPPDNVVSAISPTECLSTAHPDVTIPVRIARSNNTNIRAFSVRVALSSQIDLASGTGSITEGTYLSSVGSTAFFVTSLGGNAYQVDCSILGNPCGATAATGDLFSILVRATGSDGIGAVTPTAITFRDCSNGPVSGSPGTAASILIDRAPPVLVSNLAAAQQVSGNDTDGTTKITLTYTTPSDAEVIEVYRKGYGGYPRYDDAGGSDPTPPSYPPVGWTPVPGAAPTGVVDEPATRDFYSYVVFTKDGCGNVSAVSNLSTGTLNYHLGDFAGGAGGPGNGDNAVDGLDISLLGAHYGIDESGIASANVAYLDVGPTTNGSASGRPTTDKRIDFEDLIISALNYLGVSAPQAKALPAGSIAGTPESFEVTSPGLVRPGQTFTAALRIKGGGRIQGFSAQLAWDASVVEPLEMRSSQFVEGQKGVVLSPRPGVVDAALFGPRMVGMSGEGEVATVTFRALREGIPDIRIAKLIARDANNQPLDAAALQAKSEAMRPAVTELLPAMPNPARGNAALFFTLAQPGAVELAVFSVDGRRIRTLARDVREAGVYRVAWDGTDERGNPVSPGMFYAHLVAGGLQFTKGLVYLR